MLFLGFYNLMQEGQTLNLNVMKKGERLFICLVPRTQNTQEKTESKLIPLTIDGLPTELDEGFIEAISQPVQERFGLLTNLEAFKANNKTVASKSAEKQSAATESTSAKNTKPSKTDKLREEAEAHEKACRWPEAHAIYKKMLEADKGNVKLQEKLHTIWEKMSQRSLFSPEAEQKEDIVTETEIEASDGQVIYQQEKQENEKQQPVTVKENITLTAENISPDDMFANIMGLAH